jgi:hypothetical protein
MKTKLIMIAAFLCLVFAAADTKAQSCTDFKMDNQTSCSWSYTLQWTCGSNIVTVNGTVNANTGITEFNPGTWPNCCTFFRITFYDQCGGQPINLWSGQTSGSLCDCNGNTANFTLVPQGTTYSGVTIQ